MKKNISWQVLVLIGLIFSVVGNVIGDGIGPAIGVFGNICLLIGFANMIIAWIKNRKIKKETDSKEESVKEIKETKSSEIKNSNNRNFIIGILVTISIGLGIFLYVSISDKKRIENTLYSELNRSEKVEKTKSLSGYWRNDIEKRDYAINSNGTLEILRKDGSLECTYEIEEESVQLIKVWFKCPSVDWPGYAELHELRFLDNNKFIDTEYIQGIGTRIDGEFIKISSGS